MLIPEILIVDTGGPVPHAVLLQAGSTSHKINWYDTNYNTLPPSYYKHYVFQYHVYLSLNIINAYLISVAMLLVARK